MMIRTGFIVLLGLISTVALADPAKKAYDIMAEAERRDEGWGDSQSQMRMIIRRKDGREIDRQVRIQSLEGESGEDKSLMIFDEPKDVRGTAFLTHSRPLEADSQWIYLPSQNRVKRISAKRRTGRFMGSEFTFEDMEAFSLEKNDYTYLREEKCGPEQLPCHVIESRPKDPYSGYEKVIFYMDKAELRAWRAEFFSKRSGKHSKTMSMIDYKQYQGKFWRSHKALMHNELSGAQTEIQWHDLRFNTGLQERNFTKSALERRQ